jgi:hypothetical protein
VRSGEERECGKVEKSRKKGKCVKERKCEERRNA